MNEPGRKRRRLRLNEPGRRSRRRSYGRRHNPLGGIGSRVLSPIKSVFTKDTLVEGLQLGAGAVATPILTNKLLDLIKKPEWKQPGYINYLAQLVGACLVGSIAGLILPPRVARNLMLGGVVGVTAVVLNREVVARVAPQLATGTAGFAGLGQPDDAYRSLIRSRVEKYLGAGMSEYATTADISGVGDYVEYNPG